jgi:hypothetical protein
MSGNMGAVIAAALALGLSAAVASIVVAVERCTRDCVTPPPTGRRQPYS